MFTFSHSLELPKPIVFAVDEFIIDGQIPLDKKEVDEFLDSFSGKAYGLDELLEVAAALEVQIRNKGHAFYRVIVPPQSVQGSIVTLQVIQFELKTISVAGNEYFSEANIINSIPNLKPGISPNTEDLAHELKVANHHPDKTLKLTFKQSDIADKVDALIEVDDVKPYRLIASASNTGTPDTGEERVSLSFQYTNLWEMDHIMTASYTTSPGHVSDINQYGLSYSAPIYQARGWLTAYYIFSDVDSGVIADVFDVSGAGTLWGLNYLQNLRRIGRYEHWLGVNYDDRLYENEIDFLGIPIGDDVRSTPVTIQYKAEYPWQDTALNLFAQWSTNLGYGSNNDSESYEAARFDADTYWDHFRYGAAVDYLNNEWRYNFNFSGQYANEALISGEQFGIGGSYSVRGYQERETSADVGYQVKLEAHSPEWEGLTGVLFYDYGNGRQQSVLPGEDASWNLASAGVGARWQWEEQLLVSMDLAETLRDGPETESDHWRLHVNLAWKIL